MSFTALRRAVAAASTETGEKSAVVKILAESGYRKMPLVQAHKNGSHVVRTYLWRDTPMGNVALVAGPSVEGQVYEVHEVHGDVDAEDVDCYLPKQGRNSALVAWKPGRAPRANADRRSYATQATVSTYGVRPLPGRYGTQPPRGNPFDFAAAQAAFNSRGQEQEEEEEEEEDPGPGRMSSYVEDTSRPLSEHDAGCPSARRAPVYGTLYDANGRKYRCLYRVVTTKTDGRGPLLASNLPSFGDSPGYPVEFQARSLARPGEQMKIRKIADHLDPNRLLLPHADPTFGAPVVWEGNGTHDTRRGTYYVLGGNSRTIALMMAPEARYRAYEAQARLLWPDVWPNEPAPAGFRYVLVRQVFPDDCPTMQDAKALNVACQMPFAQAQALAGATQRSMAGDEDPLGEALSLVRGLGVPQAQLAAALDRLNWKTVIDRTNVSEFRAQNPGLDNALRNLLGAERYNTAVAGVEEVAAKTLNAVMIGFLPRSIVEQGFGTDREERAVLSSLPMLATLATGEARGAVLPGWDLLPYMEDARAFADKMRGKTYRAIAAEVGQARRQVAAPLFGRQGEQVKALLADISPLALLLGMVYVRAEKVRDPLTAVEDTLGPYVVDALEAPEKYDAGLSRQQGGFSFGASYAREPLPPALPVRTLGALVADKMPTGNKAAWAQLVEALVVDATQETPAPAPAPAPEPEPEPAPFPDLFGSRPVAPEPQRASVPAPTTPTPVDLAVKHALGPGNTVFKWPELVDDLKAIGVSEGQAERIATATMEIEDEPSETGGIRHRSVIEAEVRALFPAILDSRPVASEPQRASTPIESTWQEIGSLQRSGSKLTITSRGDENVYIDVPGVGSIFVKVPDPRTFDLSDPGAQFREPDPADEADKALPTGSVWMTKSAQEAKAIYDGIQRGDLQYVDMGGKLTPGTKRSLTALAKRADPLDLHVGAYLNVIGLRTEYEKPAEIFADRAAQADRENAGNPSPEDIAEARNAILARLKQERPGFPVTLAGANFVLARVEGGTVYLLNDQSEEFDVREDEVVHLVLGSKGERRLDPFWPFNGDHSTQKLLKTRVDYPDQLNESRIEDAMSNLDAAGRRKVLDYVRFLSEKGLTLAGAMGWAMEIDKDMTADEADRAAPAPAPAAPAAPGDAFVARGWPMGWDGSTKHGRRLLLTRVSYLSDLDESRLKTAMKSESREARQAIVDYLDGIAGEPGVEVTPALVTLAQQIAAEFDAPANYLSKPEKRDELRLTAKGASLARACVEIFGGKRNAGYSPWFYPMWPDLTSIADSVLNHAGVSYRDRVLSFYEYRAPWDTQSNVSSDYMAISATQIMASEGPMRDALLRTGLFTRDEGWTPKSATLDASLPAPEWDVEPLVGTLNILFGMWNLPNVIPLRDWMTRNRDPRMERFFSLPTFDRNNVSVPTLPGERNELLTMAYAAEANHWSVNGGLADVRKFLSPTQETQVYTAEPFTHRLVHARDVSDDAKNVVEVILALTFPQEKMKVKLGRSVGISSSPSITVEFTGSYANSDQTNMLPPTEANAYLALSGGLLSGSITVDDVRVPLWAVAEVGNKPAIVRQFGRGSQIRWWHKHLTDYGAQPAAEIRAVRQARKRGLKVFLRGWFDSGEDKHRWNYGLETPEGVVLIIPGMSTAKLESTYEVNKSPLRDAILSGAYLDLEPWVSGDLSLRLERPGGPPPAPPPAPRPPPAPSRPSFNVGDTLTHTNRYGDERSVNFRGYHDDGAMVVFPDGMQFAVPLSELSVPATSSVAVTGVVPRANALADQIEKVYRDVDKVTAFPGMAVIAKGKVIDADTLRKRAQYMTAADLDGVEKDLEKAVVALGELRRRAASSAPAPAPAPAAPAAPLSTTFQPASAAPRPGLLGEADEFVAEGKARLGALLPVATFGVSTLGGDSRPSVGVSLGFDPKASWSNGIFMNSRHAKFMLHWPDRSIEMLTKNGTDKFRKTRFKTPQEAVNKLEKWVRQELGATAPVSAPAIPPVTQEGVDRARASGAQAKKEALTYVATGLSNAERKAKNAQTVDDINAAVSILRGVSTKAGAYPELEVEYKRAQKLGKYLAEVAKLKGYLPRGDGWEDGFGGAVDMSHMASIEDRLSRERARLQEAKSPQDREFRRVQVLGAERELASERQRLGLNPSEDFDGSDDDLLAALGAPAPAPAPAPAVPKTQSGGVDEAQMVQAADARRRGDDASGAPEYRYGLQNRPAGFGSVPKGYLRVEERKSPLYPDQTRHGIIVYPLPLSDKLVKDYELAPFLPYRAVSQVIYDRFRASVADDEEERSIVENMRDDPQFALQGLGSYTDDMGRFFSDAKFNRIVDTALDRLIDDVLGAAPASAPAPAAPAAPAAPGIDPAAIAAAFKAAAQAALRDLE